MISTPCHWLWLSSLRPTPGSRTISPSTTGPATSPGAAGYYPPPGQYPPGAPGQVAPGQVPHPVGQQPYPPPQQQPYGAAPPGQYPPQAPAGQYPPAAGFPGGAYPPQTGYPPHPGYGGAPVGHPTVALPSPGYDASHIATGDMSEEARKLKKAFGSFNTDEAKLIQVLSKPDAAQMALLRKTYRHEIGKNLEDVIAEKVKRDFGDTLLTLVRGPLKNDIVYLSNAIQSIATTGGAPTSTTSPSILLNDVLLRRSNADMKAIKTAFHQTYKADLTTRITTTIHGPHPHRTLLLQALKAERMDESEPLNPALIEADATKFDTAPKNIDPGPLETELAELLAKRSDNHIRAVATALSATRPAFSHGGTLTLEKKVKAIWARADRKTMRHSAVHIVRGALDSAGLDARLLQKCMKGLGTRDSLLIARVVKLHWQRARIGEVKAAYRRRYDKSLVDVVEKETSGDYEKLLVALLEG
ncbi:hypothetical protein ACJ72_03775 [Emergomyces africanus]|uniref:Annexin n=1 Tax=Emergomyces africanus TaxID=1955775 RepID=A0A1B7NZ53_9EURO|nr:hypothetical protein ACJ72_03775 [Emergomyces africanus]